ncbi:hypothetical protein E8E12_009062 [Didymella heteroderae]|uniref:Rhodopsin domain-containing protein n=1 Tax=Didymella heteroderae TaxID=1769908 RepID=A0A9P4WUW6_9PLEO|nr:hypothetical protein E8E12_009062 [Didymella heteroderae]
MVDDYRSQLNIVGWALSSVAIIVVGARVYCRYILTNNFGLDDAFMVLALATGIAMTVLVSVGVSHGYGLHLVDIKNPYDREKALMYTYVAPAISIMAATFGKVSMVLFLKSWIPTTPGTCINPNYFEYGGRIQSIWNAIMDLTTALFPVYIVWRLQMRKSTKWGLSFLMCGGIFAAAATFVKVYYMRDLTNLSDVTYAWSPISLWYMAEVFVLNIAGSLPTLRPLYSQFCGSLPSSIASALSRKNRTGSSSRQHGFRQETFHTVGSEPRRGHRGAGNVTVDLDEIDNMNMNTKQDAGSSTESILATSIQQVQRSNAKRSKAPSVDTAETKVDFGIQVRQDFLIRYDERSDEDALAFERSKRPMT